MARSLTYLLTDRIRWKLAAKAALGAVSLAAFWYLDFPFWALVITVAVFVSIYLSETLERKALRRTFLVLVISGLVGAKVFGALSLPIFWGFWGLWTLGFFVALGMTGFYFVSRDAVYGFLNTLVVFLISVIFFYLNRAANFWFAGPIFFVIFSAVFGEVFGFLGVRAPRRELILSLALAFVLTEIAWILGFLPLGFLNSALFLTLFSAVIRDIVVSRFRGKLDLPLFLRELAILFILGLIIFAVSNWSI